MPVVQRAPHCAHNGILKRLQGALDSAPSVGGIDAIPVGLYPPANGRLRSGAHFSALFSFAGQRDVLAPIIGPVYALGAPHASGEARRERHAAVGTWAIRAQRGAPPLLVGIRATVASPSPTRHAAVSMRIWPPLWAVLELFAAVKARRRSEHYLALGRGDQ